MTNSPPKIGLKTPAQLFASGFGAGCAPFAPGTFGTIMAIPFWWLLTFLPLPLYLLLLLISIIVGVKICGKAARELGVHDHSGIVWDEFVGFWITMIAIPPSIINLFLGFLLFRLFDIIKPWPIRLIDRKVGGGIGIMLDDIIAGLFALLSLHLILALW